MCGIVGIIKLNGEQWAEPPKEINQMLSCIAHRGPDSSNILVDGPLAMGVNRLAIIDPGEQSDQPLSSPDGRFTLAFNGEIYNYRDLRRQLKNSGYQFTTRCDTEVLLALYSQDREKCLKKLRGMFAFAIWDRKRETLFIARDRLGEKPLSYYRDDNYFIFASELPALLASPRVPRRIDSVGIASALNFMHAIAPRSPFRDIKKLPPAHYMEISSKQLLTNRYWQCRFDRVEQFADERECIKEIIRCFDDTVSLMSRCDAPVGALLSGGLDSSAVVASMTAGLTNFPTFRISSNIDNGSSLEKRSAQLVSNRYNTNHFEYDIHPKNLQFLTEVVRHHGEPIATAVPVDAYMISREMKNHVKVALCGSGGDELFGGYHEHQLLHILDTYSSHTGCPTAPHLGKGEENFAREIYQRYDGHIPERIFARLKYNDFSIKRKAFSPKMQEICLENSPHKSCIDDYLDCRTDKLVNGFFNQQLRTISQYSMAEINDRMGMAHSVEIRSPFLDVEMVELAMRIPSRFKVNTSREDRIFKKILRKAMSDRLPEETLGLEKIGFGGTVPIENWLQNDCSEFIEEKLQSDALADCGLFDLDGIQELYTLYQCGAALDRDLFVGLAATAIWLEEFF